MPKKAHWDRLNKYKVFEYHELVRWEVLIYTQYPWSVVEIISLIASVTLLSQRHNYQLKPCFIFLWTFMLLFLPPSGATLLVLPQIEAIRHSVHWVVTEIWPSDMLTVRHRFISCSVFMVVWYTSILRRIIHRNKQ